MSTRSRYFSNAKQQRRPLVAPRLFSLLPARTECLRSIDCSSIFRQSVVRTVAGSLSRRCFVSFEISIPPAPFTVTLARRTTFDSFRKISRGCRLTTAIFQCSPLQGYMSYRTCKQDRIKVQASRKIVSPERGSIDSGGFLKIEKKKNVIPTCDQNFSSLL